MDPFYSNKPHAMSSLLETLPALSEIERMLISLHQPVMRIYRLKKSGAFGFDGNVVNIVQNVQDFAIALPRSVSSLSVVVVRRKTGELPTYTSNQYIFFCM